MTTSEDAVAIGQKAIRLGLVTSEQVDEGFEEVGKRGGEALPLVRALERRGYLTSYQTQKLLKGDQDGYFMGGYRLQYKIASGSFGRVFRAEDLVTGKQVAIKVLRNRWAEDPRNVEQFKREGELGQKMKHPNIVEILSVQSNIKKREHFIVMEFVEGGNLREFLNIRKKLEPLEALKLLEDAANGLVYAYAQKLTHRDIKLTNILISSQGHGKLVDFGLADMKQTGGKDDVQVDRTVDYAGLEKATSVSPGDTRSDIYFLGCVLFELLTGRPPLDMTKNKQERMRSQRFQNVKPMSPDEVNGPPSLFRLVETMMALDVNARYQTPSQLLEAIRSVIREIESGGGSLKSKTKKENRTVFIVQKDLQLQDKMRENFKGHGFRPFLSGDPARALDRYRQNPFDSLVMDIGTVGEDGIFVFEKIMSEADDLKRECPSVLILSEKQQNWIDKVDPRSCVAVMVRPVTMKQLRKKIEELLESQDS